MEQTQNNENNDLMVVNKNDMASLSLMESFNNPTDMFYCSMKDDGSRKSKIAIYNAINSADENVADHINEVLEVVNIVAHPVTLTDEETGEIIDTLRTVLITKDGKAYQAVSGGIVNALTRIMSIVGKPDGGAWEKEPVRMKIKQLKTRNGNNKVNTIELV